MAPGASRQTLPYLAQPAFDELLWASDTYGVLVVLQAMDAGGKDGAILVKGEPGGAKMGRIVCNRGHMALLPKGAAYRFLTKPWNDEQIKEEIRGALRHWRELYARGID